MIALSYKEKQLVLESTSESSKRTVLHPLHTLYLKSTLDGELEEENYVWTDRGESELIDIIENIINHFKRYDISVEVDDQCLTYLKKKRENVDAFADLLKRGRATKKTLATHSRDRITHLLSTGFKRHLKDFQISAIDHLLTINNGANYSVPGSGKTTVALAYYHILRNSSDIDGLLVVGPAACFEPWEYEFYECFGTKPNSVRIAGIPKVRRDELYLLADQYEMVLTTYHSASRDIAKIIDTLKRKRYLIVLDEAHYIKRPQGGKIADAIISLAKHAGYRVILTGTPMPNSLEDLWSQFAFLWRDQSPLGSVESYLVDIKTKSIDTALASVKEKIDPLFFRTTKRQLDLPRVSFKIIKCDLSPLQSRIYNGVAIQFLSQLKEEPKDRDAFREWRRARAIRLLQIASNPTLLRQECKEFLLPPMELGYLSLKQGIEHYANYETPGKFNAAEQIVKQLCDSGSKVIIWSSFIYNLIMMEKVLDKYSPVLIYGNVPISSSDEQELTREQLIAKFKTDDSCRLLIANPAACAESISLHKVCHNSIYLDRTFNCAHYMQSLDRIHRIGLESDQKTCYYILIANNTIDEIIHERLKQKMFNMEHVLEDDFPGVVPGYWADYFGDEEKLDLDMVEEHIRKLASKNDS